VFAVQRVRRFTDFMQKFVQHPFLRLFKIIGDHQCGFQHNQSTTDHISHMHELVEKKQEYNETVHKLFVDFKKAYNSVRREILYSILIEFGVPMKLVQLIKICLN
jgi:hypothetical protein